MQTKNDANNISLRNKKIGKIVQYTAAIIVTLIVIFPIYWMVITSLKTSDEMLLAVPTLVPKQWAPENYSSVLKSAPFALYVFNTIVMTLGIMVLQLSIGIMAAYGFARGNFPGKDILFVLVLGALMIPIQVTFVPIYVMMARLSWINTFKGLIIPNAVSAYFIFMLRQTFMSVDQSYLDAAKVDGMNRFRVIANILVPMCKPTIITVTIITFIDGWNAYFWPRMVTNKVNMRTIAQGVYELRRSYAGLETVNYNQIMAGAVMAIIPIIILFVILQKYILTGVSKAAMK